MHSPEFIKIIDQAATELGIETIHFPTEWAIKLLKNNETKFIVGYTFPINNSSSYKIARSKNLCSEILSTNKISNVPHSLLFSPTISIKRKSENGNIKIIQNFIDENGFPFLIKRNNSSKGEGVFLIHNEPELENVLAQVYSTDNTLCLSPYRKIINEYRNVVLNNQCLLSFEKQIPNIIGNGQSLLVELLSEYLQKNIGAHSKAENIVDESLLKRLKDIPAQGEVIPIQWKHNASYGTKYEIIDDEDLKIMAVKAARSINANFVSVDIIYSEKYGLEVLEINASVVLNSFSSVSTEYYNKAVDIYKSALKELYNR